MFVFDNNKTNTVENIVPWCRVLREKAREEFELNRNEKDPLIIARKLVMGWEAIEETKKRFNTVEDVIKKRIENTRIRT